MRSVIYFERHDSLPGTFDSLFGGLYLVKGLPLIGQLGTVFFVCLAALSAVYAQQGDRRWKLCSTASSLLFFSLSCVFLLQPWDELFINLRHAWSWVQTGRFSFNPGQWLEGTVDTIPYLLVGWAGKAGIPLVEGAFLLSYVGGLLCLYQLNRLFRAVWPGPAESFFLLALCLFPPLGFNSAHGFATAFFSAAILFVIRCLFFENRFIAAWVALAFLPLIRFEGSFFIVVLGTFWAHARKIRFRTAVTVVTVALVPAIAHGIARHTLYGEAIPLPVQFKSSGGSLFFLAVGFRNLLADLIATHCLTLLLLLFSLRNALAKEHQQVDWEKRKQVLAALAICIFPYYLSGGDWFPSYWARYLLPFTLFLFFTASSFSVEAFHKLTPRVFFSALILPVAVFIFASLWPISSVAKWADSVFSHRRTLAMIQEPTIARGHYRVQALSQLGEHLRLTTTPQDRIGSSELATVMYYAHREGVDFLGLMNKQIAQSPLRPRPSWLRKFPYRSELPFLIFKRVNPDQLSRYRPEILYTFDFMLRDQLKEVRAYELDTPTLFRALSRWEKQLGGLIEALYGGLENIDRLGYEPVVIKAGEDFVALYFVHRSILARHQRALEAQGYRGGRINYTHPAAPFESIQGDPVGTLGK